MKIEKAGIYYDVEDADYFSDPCPSPSLTQSIAKVLIDHSELHAKYEHPRFTERDDDDDRYDKAKAIGNAAHSLLLGRGKNLAVCCFDNWLSKDAKVAKAQAIASGLVPILEEHAEIAGEMVRAVKKKIVATIPEDANIAKAFRVGNSEVMVCAEEDGIWFRSLIDFMADTTLLFDFKTTGKSVAPHALSSLMADAGWPIQAAMQEKILDIIDPQNAGRRKFYFVAQENYKPYEASICLLPESSMVLGRKMLRRATTLWSRAIKSGDFPGYPMRVQMPEYPQWTETRWLEREYAEESNVTNILAAG